MHIGESVDANEFYENGYGVGRVNFVLTNLQISSNGVDYTDAELSPLSGQVHIECGKYRR